MRWCWWCEQFPWVGVRGKAVNYWMQKCDPALMDVEWDNQEANDDRNICEREQRWRALYLALDIQNASITPNYTRAFLMHWLTILCSCRAHECIPTQRASSGLTAVHEVSAELAVLVWLHIDAHTHKYTQDRELKEWDSALRVHGTWKATKQYVVLDRQVS